MVSKFRKTQDMMNISQPNNNDVQIDDLELLAYEDNEKISPLEKYQKIGKFPTQLIVHILLALFGALQVLVIINKITDYARQEERVLYKMLLTNDDQEGGVNKKVTLNSIPQLQEFVTTTLQNFNEMKENNLEIMHYGIKPQPVLEFDFMDLLDQNMSLVSNRENNNADEYYEKIKENLNADERLSKEQKLSSIGFMNYIADEGFPSANSSRRIRIGGNTEKKKYLFHISSDNIGPLGGPNQQVRKFLRNVSVFKIKYSLKTYIPYFYQLYFECFHWNVNQEFSFLQRSIITITLFINRSPCLTFNEEIGYLERIVTQKLWIHMIVLVLGIISLYLCSRYISKIAHVYMISKRKLQMIDTSYSKSEESEYYNPFLNSSTGNNMAGVDNEPFQITKKERNDLYGSIRKESNEEEVNIKDQNIDKIISKEESLSKVNVISTPENKIETDITNTNKIAKDRLDKELKKNKKQAETTYNVVRHLSMIRNYSVLGPIKRQSTAIEYAQEYPKVELGILEKEHHLNLGWTSICILACIFQIFGSLISLTNESKMHFYCELLLGVGCMFSCINLGRYFYYAEDYDTIYATISDALPHVLRYLFSVGTLFLGFAILGVCLFWKSDKYFDSPSTAFMTLFALTLGDSLFDVFTDIGGFTIIIGYLYTYAFCIMFIAIVLNVFIVLLEDSYNDIKLKSNSHWLLNYVDRINYTKNKLKENKISMQKHDENLKEKLVEEYKKVIKFFF